MIISSRENNTVESLQKAIDSLKTDLDALMPALQKYIDAKVEEEVEKRLKGVKVNASSAAAHTINQVPAAPEATCVDIPSVEVPSMDIPTVGMPAPREKHVGKRSGLRRASTGMDYEDDFDGFHLPDSECVPEDGPAVDFPPAYESVSKSEPVPSVQSSAPAPEPVTEMQGGMDRARYAKVVEDYNSDNFTPILSLGLSEEIANELSLKSTISDWFSFLNTYHGDFLLDQFSSTSKFYDATTDAHDFKVHYIVPKNNYCPDQAELVRYAFLEFFEYPYDSANYGDDFKLVKPAIFIRDAEGKFHIDEKGIIEVR